MLCSGRGRAAVACRRFPSHSRLLYIPNVHHRSCRWPTGVSASWRQRALFLRWSKLRGAWMQVGIDRQAQNSRSFAFQALAHNESPPPNARCVSPTEPPALGRACVQNDTLAPSRPGPVRHRAGRCRPHPQRCSATGLGEPRIWPHPPGHSCAAICNACTAGQARATRLLEKNGSPDARQGCLVIRSAIAWRAPPKNHQERGCLAQRDVRARPVTPS